MATLLTDSQLLGKLVAFDSTSEKSNLPIADFICDYLGGSAIEISRNENDDHAKVNLIIRVSGRNDDNRNGLVLSGHMDVVPAAEPQWQSDPFNLLETEESFVGRGVADMKGFLALAINAARRAAGRGLARPLVLILTYDEELGTLGAQHVADTWQAPFPLPQSAIIGEPTSLRVIRMHKGYLKMRIVFHGKSAHSGYPDLGINAIEPAGPVITALSKLARELRNERPENSEYFPETPFVALVQAMISGGTALNIVPDRCELRFGARLLPGMESGPLLTRVETAIRERGGLDGYAFDVISESPPMLTGDDAPIHRHLCDMLGQTESFGASYATDAGALQRLGLDCVLFGPGTIEVAHRPNESLGKREFAEAARLLERIVADFCES